MRTQARLDVADTRDQAVVLRELASITCRGEGAPLGLEVIHGRIDLREFADRRVALVDRIECGEKVVGRKKQHAREEREGKPEIETAELHTDGIDRRSRACRSSTIRGFLA